MVELNSARIIREARQTKPYYVMTYAESNVVSTHPNLNGNEKYIWTKIAGQSSPDSDYSCILTQGQIASLVGMSLSVVRKAISKLRNNGFLKTESSTLGGALKYFLTLPQAGLESILATPNRKIAGEAQSKNSYPSLENEVPPVQNERPPRPIRTTPPSRMNDLYNIYNINNKHNHNLDAHSDIPATPIIEPSASPEADMQNADALICDFKKIIQEKYQHLPIFKRDQAAFNHFDANQKILICKRQLELAAISERQKVQADQLQQERFNEKLAQATPVPESRPKPADCKLVEFEFDNEYFLVEEEVKDQILNQIPNLYQQNKILGDARQKPLNTLLKEIFYYVTKAGSMALDSCQPKRFFIAKKLCQKGAWERPNGLERQASIHREQKWQKAKTEENRTSTAFAQELGLKIA